MVFNSVFKGLMKLGETTAVCCENQHHTYNYAVWQTAKFTDVTIGVKYELYMVKYFVSLVMYCTTPRSRWEDNIKIDLQEVDVEVWTRSSWLRVGTSGGHL